MKIAIRADGGSQIGMGHIMRTLVLAKELTKANEVFYICRVDELLSNKYKPGIDKIKLEGFHVIKINEARLLKDLLKIKVDCLITDSYEVNEEYFNITKKFFKYTIYIDDMNLHYFNVDFIINQNVNAEKLKYKVNNDTKLMLGCKYVMLREEFRKLLPKHIKSKSSDMMISLGGADPNNFTEEILAWIKELDYTFHVAVGPSFKNTDKLENLKSEKVKLYYKPNMKYIMDKCDIAISACGSTLYELAACGVPTLGIIMADNQEALANNMHKEGIINNIGWYSNLNKDILINDIEKLSSDYSLRKNMSYKGRKLIDGKGIKRICNEISI